MWRHGWWLYALFLAPYDVSSVFDSADRCILLQCLFIACGLTDKPLKWLCSSFLSVCSNCFTFGSSRSAWVNAPFGVPEGSQYFDHLLSKRLALGPNWIPLAYVIRCMLKMFWNTPIICLAVATVQQLCLAMVGWLWTVSCLTKNSLSGWVIVGNCPESGSWNLPACHLFFTLSETLGLFILDKNL